jgi:hypothetical protein
MTFIIFGGQHSVWLGLVWRGVVARVYVVWYCTAWYSMKEWPSFLPTSLALDLGPVAPSMTILPNAVTTVRLLGMKDPTAL